ncbi:sensor histidine kinase [Candidatus Weimeria sp. HCP3S3_B5]|uniref:sensor histidine kinase n=1 Tax=Candidatus Weimeria sp. HCP3S3_B5 TaxID=3438871 RepID=UPI003F8A6125
MKLIFSLEKKLHSMRAAIFLALLLLGVIPGVITGGIFFRMYESRALDMDAVSMTNQTQLLSDQILSTGYLKNTQVDEINTQLKALGNIYSGRIIIIDNSLRVVKDTYDISEGKTFVWKNVIESLRGQRTSVYDRVSHCLIITVPIQNSDSSNNIEGVILVTRSTENMEQNLSFYRNLLVYLSIVIIVVVFLLSCLLADRFTRPLHKLSDAIKDSQELHDEVAVEDFTETGDISHNYNEVMRKMRAIDESRQEFVSNVSHELKTPLTSMKVLADSLNAMEDEATIDMYQDFMHDITQEIDRETKIINDLLSLVRMDKSGATLNITSVNINDMLESLLKRLGPIAKKQNVELVLESFRPVTAEVDEVKLSLGIMNLIENGIKYNDKGGYVHVTLNADHQYFYISIEDNGMGIPKDSIEHIFDRFYRVDKSHSREIGGTGLGLAITKNAIDMHRGLIKVHSEVGEGTTFDVRVPLIYIKEQA